MSSHHGCEASFQDLLLRSRFIGPDMLQKAAAGDFLSHVLSSRKPLRILLSAADSQASAVGADSRDGASRRKHTDLGLMSRWLAASTVGMRTQAREAR